MAPTKKKPSDAKSKLAVLLPEPTGIKKTKSTRTSVANGISRQQKAHHVKLLANGLADLTSPPQNILNIAKRNAATSPLLRLPAEIRNTIWKLAVGGQCITPPKGGQIKGGAFVAKGVSDSVPVPETSGSTRETRSSRFPRHQNSSTNASRDDHAHAIRKIRNLERAPTAFHLAEVCRQIYSETATLAYSSNIFQVDRKDDTWIKTLLPAQRDAVFSMKPIKYLAIDMYSTGTLDNLRMSTVASLRPWFRNLKEVHLAADMANRLKTSIFSGTQECRIYYEEDWRDVASLVKMTEGHDVEVVLEEEALEED